MTGALPATSREKLAQILGLLGSPDADKRALAAQAAHTLVTQAGLKWRQVLRPPPVEKALPELGTWRETAARCLARPELLRKWEIGFLRDLPGFRRLSTKQRYVLKEIADRVLGAGR